MKVRMVQRVSGTRDGADWPDVGETLDVSAGEAEALIAAGIAAATDAPAAKPAKRTAVKNPPENSVK